MHVKSHRATVALMLFRLRVLTRLKHSYVCADVKLDVVVVASSSQNGIGRVICIFAVFSVAKCRFIKLVQAMTRVK